MKVGVGVEVKLGTTIVSVAMAATVASIEPVLVGRKLANPARPALTNSDRPTIRLVVIMTAANTVSRASVG